MNILIIGSGGREHSIANSLKKSKSCNDLFCVPGNPGISTIAKCISLEINNHKSIINFCKENNISLVVIGPEQPLAEGLSDAIRSAGVSVFGPSQAAAQLESSKSFAKNFMKKYNIPTAEFATFDKSQLAQAKDYTQKLFISKNNLAPVVIKADGLAAGKGVTIAETQAEAFSVIDKYLSGEFGEASKKIIIEEFLQGFEASIFAICDGNDFITLAPAQDHKRIGDGNTGKNTGGMGAYAPSPLMTNTILEKINNQIIKPTLKGMNAEKMPFVGCLYVGLMIDKDEPKVVEYNVRFGDPETQAVLSIFEGDFAKLLYSAANENIDKTSVKNIAASYACCVILASNGYPEQFETGFEITEATEISNNLLIEKKYNSIIFHSGTKIINKKLVTSGGRVLGVTALGDTLQQAIENAYNRVSTINFQNKYYRTDIGKNIFSVNS